MAINTTAGDRDQSPILVEQGRPNKTPAPGAISSPQLPGQVPDRSTVPGHHSLRVPRAKSVRRPLTQYGTAQEITYRFRKYGADITPEQFEQATASFQELRKVDLAALPPVRPAPGYVLDEGEKAPVPIAATSTKGPVGF